MIFSEIAEVVHSNVENRQIFSEEEPDFRFLDEQIRITEQDEPRNLEDDTQRLIE